MMSTTKFFRARLLSATILFATGLAVGGCALAGYAAHAVGAPPVDAQFVPPKVPTLILVKEQPDPSGVAEEADEIAVEVEERLTRHEVVPIVSSGKVSDLRASELEKFGTMSPMEIGKSVGAKQVILVEILHSSNDAGPVNDMLKGEIAAQVSVYDVQKNEIAWPTDGRTAASLTYQTPMLRVSEEVNASGIQRNLHAGISDQIAKLFYKYKPDDEEE